MTVQRPEHFGVVVGDLAAATRICAALGLELEGEASVEGGSADRMGRARGRGEGLAFDANHSTHRRRHAGAHLLCPG